MPAHPSHALHTPETCAATGHCRGHKDGACYVCDGGLSVCQHCGGFEAGLDTACPSPDAFSVAEWTLVLNSRRTAPVTEAFLRGVGFAPDPAAPSFLRLRIPDVAEPSFLTISLDDAARGEGQIGLSSYTGENEASSGDGLDETILSVTGPGAVRTEADVLLLLRALKIRP